jgi:hypothetical protein
MKINLFFKKKYPFQKRSEFQVSHRRKLTPAKQCRIYMDGMDGLDGIKFVGK